MYCLGFQIVGKSPNSHRTPKKAIPLNVRRNHDCGLVESPKATPFMYTMPNTKSGRTPPTYPWHRHRIIQGVSANALQERGIWACLDVVVLSGWYFWMTLLTFCGSEGAALCCKWQKAIIASAVPYKFVMRPALVWAFVKIKPPSVRS